MRRGWWFRFREWIWRNFSGRRVVAIRRPVRSAASTAEKRYRRESLGTVVWRWINRLIYVFILASLSAVLLFRYVDPPTTLLMQREKMRLGSAAQNWRSIEQISPDIRYAVIAAEDANFCRHRGFDIPALRKAVADWRAGGKLIGASTISQQTAKNVFLWPARSLVRKGFEFWFTALIEIFWSKERILEVYLNVAEFGPGVFGVEEAAQRSFGASASTLRLESAARLAAVLPAPKRLRPAELPPERAERLQNIVDGARLIASDGRGDCID